MVKRQATTPRRRDAILPLKCEMAAIETTHPRIHLLPSGDNQQQYEPRPSRTLRSMTLNTSCERPDSDQIWAGRLRKRRFHEKKTERQPSKRCKTTEPSPQLKKYPRIKKSLPQLQAVVISSTNKRGVPDEFEDPKASRKKCKPPVKAYSSRRVPSPPAEIRSALLSQVDNVGKRSSHKRLSDKQVPTLRPHPAPLTEANLQVLMSSTSSKSISAEVSIESKSTAPSSKSSHSSRASIAAKDPSFERALRDVGVDFDGDDEPVEESVNNVLSVLKRVRDSPEPDTIERNDFHRLQREVARQNESAVVVQLTTKLIPLTSNAHLKLVCRFNTAWKGWGSSLPGSLPVPQPDMCFVFARSVFGPDALALLKSPYPQADAFAPCFPIEVKSSMAGGCVSTRQSANNMSLIMQEDFDRLKELNLHKNWDRSVRFLASGHNDGSMWWDGWYYVLNEKDEPRWCFRRLAVRNFEVRHEDGFETVRRYNKNWQEHLVNENLPALQAQLKKIHLLHIRPLTPATSHLGTSTSTPTYCHADVETPADHSGVERAHRSSKGARACSTSSTSLEAMDPASTSRRRGLGSSKGALEKRRRSARLKYRG